MRCMEEPDICETFAANVRRIRRSKEMSQETLAELAGLHRTYVTIVEKSGKRKPTIDVAQRIAKALSVSICDLLTDQT